MKFAILLTSEEDIFYASQTKTIIFYLDLFSHLFMKGEERFTRERVSFE
jgi:hypothetical protein